MKTLEKMPPVEMIPVAARPQPEAPLAPPLISCLIPVFNEAANLVTLVPQLCEQLAGLSPRYEVVLVDDGSSDNSAEVAADLSERYPVRLLQLSRNFGKENALTAGIDQVRGDLVLLMDADFQHPLDMLPRFFQLWRQGYDMVYGVRASRRNQGFWLRHFSQGFYRLLRVGAEVEIQADAGDFRLLDRKVVDALRALPERNRFMKGLYSWVGFKSIGVPFNVAERQAGSSGFNARRLLDLAVTGMTSFSSLPLRIWGGVGVVISLLSIFYGIYITVKTLVLGVDLPGWATLTVAVTFLGGIQLLSIGVLGEYIARIFTEVKSRPPYLIRRRHDYDNPDTGFDADRKPRP